MLKSSQAQTKFYVANLFEILKNFLELYNNVTTEIIHETILCYIFVLLKPFKVNKSKRI